MPNFQANKPNSSPFLPSVAPTGPKRAFNLTLSANTVALARGYTANLSSTVESLLTDYVAAQQRVKANRQQQASSWCADWNQVHTAHGSFADEHTTL